MAWTLVLFSLIAAGLYATSLNAPFVFDDSGTIVENSSIRQLWPLVKVLSPLPQGATAGRPLVNLSFALNYAVGGLTPWGYRLGNLAIHVGVALLLLGILHHTFERGRRSAPPLLALGPSVAFASALLWLIHPVNTEVMNYVTERTESMMALFYLLVLYAATRAMGEGPRAAIWSGTAVVACGLGMATKESMVTAPIMVLLYDAVFEAGSIGRAVRRRWLLYAGLAATWLILLALNLPGPRSNSAGLSSGVSPWTYLLNQAPVVVTYLKLVIWPAPLVLDYGKTPATTLAAVWPYALVVVVLLGVVALTWRLHRPLAFLGTWFFVTLAPSSSVVPIATEVAAERRLYVPLAAAITLVVCGVYTGLARVATQRPSTVMRTGGLLLIVTCGLLGVLTFRRNTEYKSPIGIWRTVVARQPHGRAHYNLAGALRDEGQRAEALEHYRIAAVDHAEALYALGFEADADGQTDAAIAYFREFMQKLPLDQDAPRASNLLGRALLRRAQPAEALRAFLDTLRMRPRDLDAQGGAADALLALQRYADAERYYRAYLIASPRNANAQHNLGFALMAQGQERQAIEPFAAAARLDPTNPGFRLNLGNALAAEGRLLEAVQAYREGLEIAPTDSRLHDALGLALAARGDLVEARQHLERAIRLDPTNPLFKADYQSVTGSITR